MYRYHHCTFNRALIRQTTTVALLIELLSVRL
eukprot:COSAG02_NODE_2032_length_10063_cov_11.627057_9_plen_31_part_01